MEHFFISVQKENTPIHHQISLGHTEYRLKAQPHHPPIYQQQLSPTLSTYPVIIPHHIMHQSSPPESPRSICSSSDESHQKPHCIVPKKKRTRTAFNSFQVMELEREYRRSMYMQRDRRQEVAQRLSLDEKHIKIWFQNRRMRYKREGMLPHKEKTMERVETECTSTISSDHEDIVKHFMSFAQTTLTQQSAPASLEFKETHATNLLPPSPPPTESTELTEILDLLVDSSSSASAIPITCKELSSDNITDILDYLQESSPPISNQNTCNKEDDFGNILNYLTESSKSSLTPKEDSDLNEILNYLSENLPSGYDMNHSSVSSVPDSDLSLDKIRNDLEKSAEAFANHSIPT